MGDNGNEAKQFGRNLTNAEICEMALFRHRQRILVKASEEVAHAMGVEFGQFQTMLAILAAEIMEPPMTETRLSQLLLLKLHSTVEMIDRLEARGLVHRERDRVDLRQVFVHLTKEGDTLMQSGLRRSVVVIQQDAAAVGEVALRIFT